MRSFIGVIFKTYYGVFEGDETFLENKILGFRFNL